MKKKIIICKPPLTPRQKRESAGAIPDTAVHDEENVEEEEILMENAEVEAVPEKDVLEVADTNKEELLALASFS